MTTSEPREKTIRMKSPVMEKNDAIAAMNRQRLDALGLFAINIMSSPGSGKTTLLEKLAERMKDDLVVIEGDVQTRRDAERLERVGCRVYQIETHGACHLDAQAISVALDSLDLAPGKHKTLIIENVGNLICPGGYDLGEHLKMGLLSVPEGDDKVLKYPSLFCRVGVLAITKIDLLPLLEFDVERAVEECRSLNPGVRVFHLSAKTEEGLDDFCDFVRRASTFA